MMQAARRFTVADFAALKLCCLAVGVLLGVYLGKALQANVWLVWLLAGLTCGYLCVRLVRLYRGDRPAR